MHRESYRVYHEMTEKLAGVEDPAQRLMDGSPWRCAWSAEARHCHHGSPNQRPIGGEMAEQPEAIKAPPSFRLGNLGQHKLSNPAPGRPHDRTRVNRCSSQANGIVTASVMTNKLIIEPV